MLKRCKILYYRYRKNLYIEEFFTVTISSRLRQQPGAAEREVQPRPAGPARAAVQRRVQGARARGEGLYRVIQ